jgi:hypothetical protein
VHEFVSILRNDRDDVSAGENRMLVSALTLALGAAKWCVL